MNRGVVRAIIVLPGTALVLIPALLVHLARDTKLVVRPAGPAELTFWVGVLVGCVGAALIVWTAALFRSHGNGTLAPWNPPRRLVIRGPYRHVRNPMITGVLLVLVAESLFLRSLPVAIWAATFFGANAIYFPLSEEKRLEARFGDAYRMYLANVPRWVPRFRGWDSD